MKAFTFKWKGDPVMTQDRQTAEEFIRQNRDCTEIEEAENIFILRFGGKVPIIEHEDGKFYFGSEYKKYYSLMNRVINGRRYSIKTAEQVAAVYGQGWNEELYRKQTGEYFLYCAGDSRSKFAVKDGNKYFPASTITPMTLPEAQEWAANNVGPDKYQEIFGVPDTEKHTTCTFSLSARTISRISSLAATWSCGKSEVIERIVNDYYDI
jgi:hypothetical protein